MKIIDFVFLSSLEKRYGIERDFLFPLFFDQKNCDSSGVFFGGYLKSRNSDANNKKKENFFVSLSEY